MALLNQAHVNKGKTANLVGLRQQCPVSLKLATSDAFAGPLDEMGWTQAKSNELREAAEQLGTGRCARLEVRGDSQRKTKTEAQKRQVAKAIIRRMRNALPSVLETLDPEDAAVTGKQFLSGHLRDSSPLIGAYLEQISAPLLRLDQAFRPYNRGQSLHAEVVRAQRELAETDGDQEVARGALPADTLAFYALKGRVLSLIEELNRLARNAFDGHAHLIGQFNKDLLLRATKARLMPAAEEEDGEAAAG